MSNVSPESPVYSFRAECPHDFYQFIKKAIARGIGLNILEVKKGGTPEAIEPQVEIRTQADLESLRYVMRSVENGQVMLQTLRPLPLAENSMERDYAISVDSN